MDFFSIDFENNKLYFMAGKFKKLDSIDKFYLIKIDLLSINFDK